MAEITRAHERFEALPGIGPALSRRLAAGGARTLADLRRDGVYSTLPRAAQAALDYPTWRAIPVTDARAIGQAVRDYARIDGARVRRAAVVGSAARGEQFSGDIDVLVEDAAPWRRALAFGGPVHLVRIISAGPQQFMVMAWVPRVGVGVPGARRAVYPRRARAGDWPDLPRGDLPAALVRTPGRYVRIDLFRASPPEWPFAFLHYTNGEVAEKRLRAKAKHAGLFLNARGLFRRHSDGSPGARIPPPPGGWTPAAIKAFVKKASRAH